MQIRKIAFTLGDAPRAVQKTPVASPFEAQKREYSPLSAAHYSHTLSFTGGYSIDLEKSIDNLSALEAKRVTEGNEKPVFPPDVKKEAKKVLDFQNPENKTLIDIHKDVYSDLQYVDNIEELREFFPIFKDVISSKEVTFQKGSLGDKIQNGELHEHFNPENDIALDLVRLLYMEGFSTNDLKGYTGGTSPYSLMMRLNIPALDRDYAHILKFSDKDYNERLTTTMAQNRRDSIERKEQSGEPVFIPKAREGKPLSDEHKKAISEGLLKYHAEHPEKAYELSERQKKYYEQNPEQAELFSKALEYAWKNSHSVKKKMSKFFKRELLNKELNPFKMSKEDRNLMKEFWDRNYWAKVEFGKNLKAGWEWAKSSQDTQTEVIKPQRTVKPEWVYVKTTPDTLVRDIQIWANRNGIKHDFSDMNTYQSRSLDDGEKLNQTTHTLATKYYDEHPNVQDILGDTYSKTLCSTINYIRQACVECKDAKRGKSLLVLDAMITQELSDLMKNSSDGYVSTTNLSRVYGYTLNAVVQLSLDDVRKFMDGQIETDYEEFKANGQKKYGKNFAN